MSWAKLARESLERGAFQEAVEYSDYGLEERDSKSQYLLQVLKGAALKGLKHLDGAEECYKSAIRINSELPLAWQGLLQLIDTERLVDPKLKDKLGYVSKKEECLKRLVETSPEPKKAEWSTKLLEHFRGEGKILEAATIIKEQDEAMYVEFIKDWEREEIKREVDKSRYRLGADPLPILQERTAAATYKSSPLTASMDATEELVERLYLILRYYPKKEIAERLLACIRAVDCNTSRVITAEIRDSCNDLVVNGLPEESLPVLLSKALAQRTLQAIGKCRARLNVLETMFNIKYVDIPKVLNRLEGLALVREREYELAIPLLQPDANNVEARTALIDCYEALERYEEAMNVLRQMGDDEATTVRLCWMLYHTRDYDQLSSILSSTHFKAERFESDRLLLLGIVKYEKNLTSAAFDLFLQAAKCNPDSFKPFYWLGVHYQSVDDSDRAERCFKKALSLNASDQRSAQRLSLILLLKGQFAEVVQLLEPLLKTFPREYNSWVALGTAYFNLKCYQKALHALHICLRNKGSAGDKRIFLLLGHSYFCENKLQAAARAFKAVLNIDADDVTALLVLGKVMCALGEFDESISCFKRCLAINRTFTDGITCELVACLLKAARSCLRERFDRSTAGSYLEEARPYISSTIDMRLQADYELLSSNIAAKPIDNAVQKYQQAVIAVEHSKGLKSQLLSVMAALCIKTRQFKRARDLSSTAIRLAPTFLADNIHAIALMRDSKDYEMAERHLSRAIMNSPAYSYKLWSNLGHMYVEWGRKDLAKYSFEQSRIANAERSGEALYGLYSLAGEGDLVIAADCSTSLKVHAECVRRCLQDLCAATMDAEKLDAFCAKTRPALERICGALDDCAWFKELLSVVEDIDTLVACSPENVAYDNTRHRRAVRRQMAAKHRQLKEYIECNPFDLKAYHLLLTQSPCLDEESIDFIRGKLRLLEERYDPKEGTMKRHFSSVALFCNLRQWYEKACKETKTNEIP